MKVCLLLDPERIFRWHKWLAMDLAMSGRHEVTYCRADAVLPWPIGMELAIRLDRILHRLSAEHAIDRVAVADIDLRSPPDLEAGAQFDVVIDCSGGVAQPPFARRVLTPLFDGIPNELGALAALLDSRPIEIGVHEDRPSGALAIARPAIEHKACLTEALDNLLSRAIELIVELVDHPRDVIGNGMMASAAARPSGEQGPGSPRFSSMAAFHHLAHLVAGKISRKLSRTTVTRQRWALAVRRCPGPGLVTGAWPAEASYRIVPDDGRRYYADPFVFAYGGKTYLFCEEYPYETERGIISVSEVSPEGDVSAPYPVLERPYHLSYPFVFEDGGQIRMIPEATASGDVELYRAVEFPRRWELERRLIEGVPGCDATLLRRDGRYFIFLTVTRWRSTSWDNLRLYEAASLEGPWAAHETGLAMIDSRLSRSAGAIVEKGSILLRPTQDCSNIYGGGIVLSRIDRLSSSEYAQTAIADIVPAGPAGITGTHTISNVGAIEAIDVWGAVDGVREVSLACRPLANSLQA